MEYILILVGVWIFLGLIALGLGYIFFHEEGEKINFWNAILIVALGFFGLAFTIEDIQDAYPLE